MATVFQILLHDQGETPQMKDQGFAVAPGTHTLVGVKRFQVQRKGKREGRKGVLITGWTGKGRKRGKGGLGE